MSTAYLSPSSPWVPTILEERGGVAGVVLFNCGPGEAANAAAVPVLAHVPGGASDGASLSTSASDVVAYPGMNAFFSVPGHPDHDAATTELAHTRTVAFLKPLLGGPMEDEAETGREVVMPGQERCGWFPNMRAMAPTAAV